MKKIFIKIFICSLSVTFFSSCYKDLGNYTYHDINEISFEGIDTENGYNVLMGDSLKISPSMVMTKDQAQSQNDYSYEWTFHLTGSYGHTYDSIISTEKNLKTKVLLSAGNYFLQFKVTDKSTGIPFHIRTNVLVSTPIYEGYIVLNDVNGNSRVDMLSYNNTTNAFTQYTDVLAKVGSKVPMEGQPYQVLCMYYTRTMFIMVKYYGIFILTASGTNRVNEETFAYDPSYNIRYLMVGDVPTDFKAQYLTGEITGNIAPLFYMYSDGNIYSYTAMNGSAFKYLPLNIYPGSSVPFEVSRYIATDGTRVVMYNMEKKNFVTAPDYNSISVTDVPQGLNYPSGLDLVYMERNYSDNTYAIMKDPLNGKYYLLRFRVGQAQDYFQEITGTDFAYAGHYTFSPDLGYMFYSVGGRLYEYDLSLKTSKLMLDKGMNEISYLAFQQFFNRTETYADWAKLLTVASYNPSGTSGNNGILELYSVPPVNGQIVQMSRWSGFGKMVSISYRERY